jgi:O-methyltransferase involved in polyketide biosynthesis
VADETPSTARMIDFWLGGAHHLPVDVAAARAFEGLFGDAATEFRALRAFLGRAVADLEGRGIAQFLVVGAGIPTQGNVHEVAPQARVLYTDIDPAVVGIGQEVLASNPRAAYTTGDASDLGSIDTAVLRDTLPGFDTSPVGIVFLGLAAFLDDDLLASTLGKLHGATVPGSVLAFDFDSDRLSRHPEALAFMGPQFHMRTPEQFRPLLGPWTPSEAGIRPVATWPDAAEPADDDTDRAIPAFYGGIALH